MKKMLKQLRPREWILALLCLAFVIVQVWLDLTLPDYMSQITTLVQTGGALGEILKAGAWMLACALGSMAAAVAVAACAAKIGAVFSARLRAAQFDSVLSFSMEEINRFSTDSLITRATNDVTQVQMLLVMGLQMLLKAPIMAVWAITKIAEKNWQWTLTTGVAVLVLVSLVGLCVLLTLPKFKRLQELTDDLNRVTRENLTGLRVVRAYNAESYQEAKFEKANAELTAANLYTNRTMAFMQPGISLVMNGLTLAIYWIGAAMINGAAMADKLSLFSDMVVFSSYAMQVIMAFMLLVMVFIMLPRASVSMKRINEVLRTEPSIANGFVNSAVEMNMHPTRGEIEFQHVSFKYPDAENCVLRDVSFTAHKGETVAIIGATGCGKSSLINLIPRFYDATEGKVLVDGVNVRDYALHTLRSKLGYVSQRAILFSGSVTSNVAYGGEGTPLNGSVVDAVYTAQASEFVEQMEGDYTAYIAPGGTNLSGGQKQRLSIARALYRDAEILIFDDSFSALDYKTDRALRKALKQDAKNATCLIVAQRIGTIKDADRIIVLDEGRVVGNGTHQELLKNCHVYQEIAASQLSEEELEDGQK